MDLYHLKLTSDTDRNLGNDKRPPPPPLERIKSKFRCSCSAIGTGGYGPEAPGVQGDIRSLRSWSRPEKTSKQVKDAQITLTPWVSSRTQKRHLKTQSWGSTLVWRFSSECGEGEVEAKGSKDPVWIQSLITPTELLFFQISIPNLVRASLQTVVPDVEFIDGSPLWCSDSRSNYR